MPIAAASAALARHLRHLLREEAAPSVEPMTLAEARRRATPGICLVLWRVQPEETEGDTSPLRTASRADPPEGVGLRLRYLLMVRGTDGATEQALLGRCMTALEQNPVIEAAGGPGDITGEALVVTLETPPDEIYLRLQEACGDQPPLLLPYLVHSMRLRPST